MSRDSSALTDKNTVETVNLANLLDVLDALARLNLHHRHHALVRIVVVRRASLHTRERVRCKDRSVPAGSDGRVLGPADYLLRVGLCREKCALVVVITWHDMSWRKRRDRETYRRVTHWREHTVRALVESALHQPLLGDGNADDGARAFRGDGVAELCFCRFVLSAISALRRHCRVWILCEGRVGEVGITHLIVVVVRDHAMLGVDEDPAEAA